MKVSELLKNKFYNIVDLDKRFIDREELKDKIKLILDKHRDRYCTSYKDGEICFEKEIEKEILELIDK